MVLGLLSRGAISARRRFSTVASSAAGIRVAIVGSGPSGFYCAETLFKLMPEMSLSMYEQLPVPYGLVRYGVAPDHQDLKNCIGAFQRLVDRVGERFRFFGNIRVGRDVKVAELLQAHHAVVLAYGAEAERRLQVDGEQGGNCFSARQLVGWYNGLPECADLPVDLESHETAVVFGHGNVALDVARVLTARPETLDKTDIAEHAMQRLRRSRIRRCVLIGRRGPLQAAFTTAELRMIINRKDAVPLLHAGDFRQLQLERLERPRRRLMQLMVDTANAAVRPTGSGDDNDRVWELRFFRSPARILLSDDGRVTGVQLTVNRLVDDGRETRAEPTDERERLNCGLVISSVGYRTTNLEPTAVPFDDRTETVRTDPDGRVDSVRGLYACGWCSRGPVGVLATTQNHARHVAETVLDDWRGGRLASAPAIGVGCGVAPASAVDWRQWLRIDDEELRRGALVGKLREKIVRRDEMLAVAAACAKRL